MKISNLRKGFTLLEMLVVIGIIGIVIAAGATSYSAAQKKARDSRRKQDLTNIQKAYEQYYSICNSQYPVGAAAPVNVVASTAGGACTINQTILSPVPVDPINIGVNRYLCSGTCNATQFNYCVTLETETTQFCVANQQ